MEILYEGIKGSAPTPWVAWLFGIAAVVILGLSIFAIVENEKAAAFWCIIMMILCIIICIESMVAT